MKVEINILVENTTPAPPLAGEYGFSALVVVDGYPFLFDTGCRDALFKNAAALSIDLNRVEDVIISHGHFDHTGGLGELIKRRGDRKIHIHPHAFYPKYLSLPRNENRYIGMPLRREDIISQGGELVEVAEVRQLLPGVLLTGEIPRITGYEDTGGRFVCPGTGSTEWEIDYLPDDQALVIDHPEGLVVISGCAHAGLINTLAYACQITGRKKIKLFLGGTHLMTAGKERLDKTVQALPAYNIEKLVVCHCTGFQAAAVLYNELGGIVDKGETGFSIQI